MCSWITESAWSSFRLNFFRVLFLLFLFLSFAWKPARHVLVVSVSSSCNSLSVSRRS